MPVDDNAFLSLRNAAGNTAWLHVSCSEWKNLFSLEIYGRDAKAALGRARRQLRHGTADVLQNAPQMGPPETTIWNFRAATSRGKSRWRNFFEDIKLKRTPVPGLKEAKAALAVVGKIYQK